MATELEGVGGKAIVAGPLKKRTFFAASLSRYDVQESINYIKTSFGSAFFE